MCLIDVPTTWFRWRADRLESIPRLMPASSHVCWGRDPRLRKLDERAHDVVVAQGAAAVLAFRHRRLEAVLEHRDHHRPALASCGRAQSGRDAEIQTAGVAARAQVELQTAGGFLPGGACDLLAYP